MPKMLKLHIDNIQISLKPYYVKICASYNKYSHQKLYF